MKVTVSFFLSDFDFKFVHFIIVEHFESQGLRIVRNPTWAAEKENKLLAAALSKTFDPVKLKIDRDPGGQTKESNKEKTRCE